MAVALFLSGVVPGVIVVFALAIRREDRRYTLVREAPDRMSRSARRLTAWAARPGRGVLPAHARTRPLARPNPLNSSLRLFLDGPATRCPRPGRSRAAYSPAIPAIPINGLARSSGIILAIGINHLRLGL